MRNFVGKQPEDVPRETFIALRARRQAFRIATDLLYRDESPDGPQPHPLTYDPQRRPPLRRNYVYRGAVLALTIMAVCTIIIVCTLIGDGAIQLPTRR